MTTTTVLKMTNVGNVECAGRGSGWAGVGVESDVH